MGVRGFFSYIRSVKKYANVIKNPQLNIGVDAFCILYLFRSKTESLQAYIRGLLSLEYKLTIIMDKKAPKEKKEVVEARKEARKEARGDANDIQSYVNSEEFAELDEALQATLKKFVAQKEHEGWYLTPAHMEWFVNFVKELGCEVIWAEGEADDCLAAGGYDIVISSDSDLFVLGVDHVWVPRGVGLQHDSYKLQDILGYLGLTQDKLIELSFLAGCDTQPKSYLSFSVAVSWLRFFGSLTGIVEKHPETLSPADLELFESWKKAMFEN